MLILITGGLGLIGSQIAFDCLRRGHHVSIVDDGRASVVPFVDGARHYTTSVEDHGSTEHYDLVIHCAAPVGPVGIMGVSVLADIFSSTRAACDIAARSSASLIVMSSSEVYGTTTPSDSLVVPDEWSYRTEYGVGKIVTEQLAHRHLFDTGLPTAIVRPWNVTGVNQSARKGFVFPRMAFQATSGMPITVYAPGHQQRAFMDVADFSDGVLRLIDTPPYDGRWSCAPIDAATPGNATTMIELARMFSSHELAANDCEWRIVDPCIEHGPDFREAASGTKLPMVYPAIQGHTSLGEMVDAAMRAVVSPVPA